MIPTEAHVDGFSRRVEFVLEKLGRQWGSPEAQPEDQCGANPRSQCLGGINENVESLASFGDDRVVIAFCLG